MCKPLHFNLTRSNPDGCTRCDCGTGTKSCDTNTGACTCKDNVEVCIYNLTINKRKVGKSILLTFDTRLRYIKKINFYWYLRNFKDLWDRYRSKWHHKKLSFMRDYFNYWSFSRSTCIIIYFCINNTTFNVMLAIVAYSNWIILK